MTDLVFFKTKGGDGGRGRVSFERQKYRPKGGPSGGDGGKGGNLVIRAKSGMANLDHLAGVREVQADPGQLGGKHKKSGAAGEDGVLEVPLGTKIWIVAEKRLPQHRVYAQTAQSRKYARFEYQSKQELSRKYTVEIETAAPPPQPDNREWYGVSDLLEEPQTDTVLQKVSEDRLQRPNLNDPQIHTLPRYLYAELTEDGQEVILCQGGKGGRGNVHFKSSSNTTPLEAEYGEWGEDKVVLFELQVLADAGLVGLPNAGKSTLLSVVSSARPKIASYPFTTLNPQLGVFQLNKDQQVVLADIPGLIEQASQGKGLGFQFLRHIERCKTILYVLYLPNEQLEESLDANVAVQTLAQQFQTLKAELAAYDPRLLERPAGVVLSKTDLYDVATLQQITRLLSDQTALPTVAISSVTGRGMDELRNLVVGLISDFK